MRKPITMLCLVMLAAAAMAGPLRLYEVGATTGTNSAQNVTATVKTDAGFLCGVAIIPASGATSDVSIALVDADSVLPVETVLSVTSNAAAAIYHPMAAGADSAGAATATQTRYAIPFNYGVRMSLSNALVASKAYRVVLTVELSDK